MNGIRVKKNTQFYYLSMFSHLKKEQTCNSERKEKTTLTAIEISLATDWGVLLIL